MKTFKIYRWDTGKVIAETLAETLREALEGLVRVRGGIDLYRANLDGANLDGVKLDGASLIGANLDGASLIGANLDGTSLVGARLDGASLDGANLDGANLDRASLIGARLDGASLDGASLDFIKHDLWGILFHSKSETGGLVAALKEGRVDGSVYKGPCSCLVGTLANLRGCKYDEIPGIKPDSSRPAEVWFMAIRKGDTPETNPISRITVEWIEEFQKLGR